MTVAISKPSAGWMGPRSFPSRSRRTRHIRLCSASPRRTFSTLSRATRRFWLAFLRFRVWRRTEEGFPSRWTEKSSERSGSAGHPQCRTTSIAREQPWRSCPMPSRQSNEGATMIIHSRPATIHTHQTVPTQFVEAKGICFAYRRFGAGRRVPLVFFPHFMGNLDDHDSALTDASAADREVILFNNAGVASSTGTTPSTIGQTARDAEAFIDALSLKSVDLLGHSMGGLVTQQVAFDRPQLVRRLILVGTAPRGGVGVGEMPPETQALFFKKYEHQEEMWLPILFSPSEVSQAAGRAYLKRMMVRKE